jgi:hypothetical protein
MSSGASSFNGKQLQTKVPFTLGRKPLPADAIHEMKVWLLANLHNPYPSEKIKEQLSSQYDISIKQVTIWFINARSRYLPKESRIKRDQKSNSNIMTSVPSQESTPYGSPGFSFAISPDPSTEQTDCPISTFGSSFVLPEPNQVLSFNSYNEEYKFPKKSFKLEIGSLLNNISLSMKK